jgi:septal ring factor EnvC (AmiA/AmiB activator)
VIEDLKEIEKQIDRLWHDIRRVREALAEHPDDLSHVDNNLFGASDRLAEAEVDIQHATEQLEAFEATKTKQQDESIAAAIALLESKGFIVGTKT